MCTPAQVNPNTVFDQLAGVHPKLIDDCDKGYRTLWRRNIDDAIVEAHRCIARSQEWEERFAKNSPTFAVDANTKEKALHQAILAFLALLKQGVREFPEVPLTSVSTQITLRELWERNDEEYDPETCLGDPNEVATLRLPPQLLIENLVEWTKLLKK